MVWRDDLIDAASGALNQLMGEAAAIYNGVINDPLAQGVGTWLGETAANVWNGLAGLNREDGPPVRFPGRGGQCLDTYCLYVQVIGTVPSSGAAFDNGPNVNNSGLCGYRGPISPPYIKAGDGGFPNVFVKDGFGTEVNVFNVNGINVQRIIPDHYRQNGQGDACGDPPLFGPPPANPPPLPGPYPINPGGNHPGNIRFGAPYLDADGRLRIPFNINGDGWSMGGNVDPATGDWDFGPTLPVDANGNPLGDPNYPDPDGPGNDDNNDDKEDCVKEIICAGESWPITVPKLLSADNTEEEDLENLPQTIVWFAKQFDAVSGQYPIKIQIEDTDPITNGDQSQTISLPNQAEAIAEMFGLAYESNMNCELAVNMLFRLIPEVVAAKNSSMITQDYAQALTNWMGFRTKSIARKIDSNFNPLRADSMADFLKPSKYEVQGIEDDDPHTLVEWIQQIKYAVALMKASVFRSPEEAENLLGEMKTVIDNGQPEDSGESWEQFIDALNRANSNLTDRNFHPRPKAINVDDVLNPGTVLPDRGADD